MKDKELTDKEKQLAISFKEAFVGEHGDRVLANLKKRYTYDTVMWKRDTLGRIDPYDVTKRAAQRAVINYIVNQIEKKF